MGGVVFQEFDDLFFAHLLFQRFGQADGAAVPGADNLAKSELRRRKRWNFLSIDAANEGEKNFELPEFMFVDFNNNTVRQTEQSGGIETSPIDQFKKSEGNLVLQGIENGHGWSMVINSKSGAMTVAIAGDEIIYSVLGACTPEK